MKTIHVPSIFKKSCPEKNNKKVKKTYNYIQTITLKENNNKNTSNTASHARALFTCSQQLTHTNARRSLPHA